MNHQANISIQRTEYRMETLHPDQVDDLQTLFVQCQDFSMLVEGQEVPSTAGADAFIDVPPGRSLKDKLLFGVWNADGNLVGVMDCIRNYPEDDTWWIGLLLLSPDARGYGLGKDIMAGFVEYVRRKGGSSIMLGVVEENLDGYQFWQTVGFKQVRQTEPRTFGRKSQRVNVMRLDL